MKTIEGGLVGDGLKFCLIVGRFNSFITERLLEGALDALIRHGVKDEDITLVRVPGSFEVPLAAKKAAKGKKYDAVLALSAIIRGQTPHFDYVAAEATKGIAHVSLDEEIPISFGILTTDTIEQAIERAGTKSGNKGFDAAVTAIEMANVVKQLV